MYSMVGVTLLAERIVEACVMAAKAPRFLPVKAAVIEPEVLTTACWRGGANTEISKVAGSAR